MTKELKQLQQAIEDVCAKSKKATVLLMVDDGRKGRYIHLDGNAIDLAVGITVMMRDDEDFEQVIRMAINAFENVPYHNDEQSQDADVIAKQLEDKE